MASSESETQKHRQIPVTMLSGFLGAGKTTLLKHILESSKCKIACMVNDMAAVNIDAKLVRNTASRGVTSNTALADMVELQNGCACCSAADELFPAFDELIKHGDASGTPYERIILENSGVAEPQNIRDSFNEAIALEHPITSRIMLDGLITVVDAATFVTDFGSKAPLTMRPDLADGGGNARPVVDLLVEQIECADLIVLNKADAVDADKLEKLKPIVKSLNPLAHITQASFGRIPLELAFRSGIAARMNIEAQHRSSVMAAKETGDHHHEDGHECDEHCQHERSHPRRSTAETKYRITSFVFIRRKPFHPIRLRHLVLRWLPARSNTALDGEQPATGDSPIKRVIRSKGFAWLANSHISAFYWSHAGQHFELREEGDWWASVDPTQFPPDPEQKGTIYRDFDPEGKFGDRRQEIVFIGAEMDKAAITKQLEDALLTDAEMEQYCMNWSSMTDPPHPDMLYFKDLANRSSISAPSFQPTES